MQIFYSLPEAHEQMNASVLAIGNFDGYHIGHQSVIQQLKSLAKKKNVMTAVMIFNPHPKVFFSKLGKHKTIFNAQELTARLKSVGIDYLVCLPFTQEIANMSPEVFVKDILICQLQVIGVVVGEDFQYGKNRAGNLHTLKKNGESEQFDVIGCQPYLQHGSRVSSTLIKKKLSEGNLNDANALLTRPYFISGIVVQGDQRGSKWGFPTANLLLDKAMLLPYGIYVVSVVLNQKSYQAVASYGVRPTVSDSLASKLEIHLLEVNLSCYHKRMKVYFLHRLRDEIKFSSIEPLIQQIEQDCVDAKKFFQLKQG